MLESPASILREALLVKIDRNPSYSLRAFARDMGVSHAYLSLVMSGKKNLSTGSAIRFAQRLDEETSQRLLTSARENAWQTRASSQARPTKAAAHATNIERFQLELDRFRVLADWHHLAILDLTTLTCFRPEARWVARKLGLKTTQVRLAVKRLVRLNLLVIDERGWTKTHQHLAVPTERADAAVRYFHQGMIQKALEAFESPSDESYSARDITGTTMAINPARIPGAKERVRKFRRSLARYLMRGNCTELYQLNVQLFSLTRRVREGKS